MAATEQLEVRRRLEAPFDGRKTSLWRYETPAVLALCAVAAVHAAILVLGHYTYFAAPDNTTQFWAWYQKAAAVLHSGALPLWDANTFGGHSFVGEAQAGVFYPLNILWLLALGSAHGISPRRLDALVVLHLLIASVGFYAFARSFRVARLPAVIAGVVFAYAGVVFSRTGGQIPIFFGLALLPWALFFAHRQLETGRLRFAVGAGIAIGLGILAGHFQPPFHAALLVLLLYVLTLPRASGSWRAELKPRATGMATTLGVGVLVALPQLVYTLPYLSRAYRFVGPVPPVPPGGSLSYREFSQLYSGGPESALNLLDPQRYPVPDGNDLYIGLAALVVLLVGVLVLRRSVREQIGRYWLALCASLAIGVLAMLGPWTFFPAILYELPLVSEIRQLARYSIMVHVVLCLLLAFVLQALGPRWLGERRADGFPLRRALLAVLGVVVVLDGAFLLIRNVPGGDDWFPVQLIFGGVALLTLAAAVRLSRLGLLSVLGVLIVAASLHNGTRLPQTSSPMYPNRYYARTAAITYTESACAGHRTLVLDNALPTNVGDVYRRIRTQNGYAATMQVPFFDFINDSSWTSTEQTRLLDERCIVTRHALAVPGYRVGFDDRTEGVSVYVDGQTSPLNTPQLQPLPVRVLADTDRDKRYRVELSRPTTVILSAVVYPGWDLKVDGHAAKARSFRARNVPVFPEVTLPSGSHTIEYSWSGWPA